MFLVFERLVYKEPWPKLDFFGRLFFVFIVFALFSSLWSISIFDSLKTGFIIGLTLAGGYLIIKISGELTAPNIQFCTNAFIIGGIIGLILLSIEAFSGEFLSRQIYTTLDKKLPTGDTYPIIKPGLTVMALYIWPWFALVSKRYSVKLGLAGIVFAGTILLFGCAHTALLAFTIGALFFSAAYMAKRHFSYILTVFVIAAALFIPIVPDLLPDPTISGKSISFLPNSAIHRIKIWQTTTHHIVENPILGIGFDTSQSLYPRETNERVVFLPDIPEKSWYIWTEPIPLHPHNFLLQIWLELGLIGASLAAILICFIIRAISKIGPRQFDSAVGYGALGGALLVASVSFGAWQSWWVCTLLIIASITAVSLSKKCLR